MNNNQKYLPLKISGIGIYVPKKIISSEEIEITCGLNKGWCIDNYGIRQRYWVNDETQSYMGAEAAKNAVQNAGMELWDIDLILNASGSFQLFIPDNAPLIQRDLGLEESGIPCLTVQNNDLSFLTALDISSCMLATGRYQNILIVCSEIMSYNLDVSKPEAYALYGDAAAAIVVTCPNDDDECFLLKSAMETYSQEASCIQSLIGLHFFQNQNMTPEELAMQVDIATIKKYGKPFLNNILSKVSEEGVSFSCLIPPQINLFQETLEKKFNAQIADASFKYGYCGAAAIPLALSDAITSGLLERGNNILMLGVGAGLSVGGVSLKY